MGAQRVERQQLAEAGAMRGEQGEQQGREQPEATIGEQAHRWLVRRGGGFGHAAIFTLP
jgi:hypothetical protein